MKIRFNRFKRSGPPRGPFRGAEALNWAGLKPGEKLVTAAPSKPVGLGIQAAIAGNRPLSKPLLI